MLLTSSLTRCVAIELLVKFIKSEGSECDLNTLLSIVQLDPSARIRVFTGRHYYKTKADNYVPGLTPF